MEVLGDFCNKEPKIMSIYAAGFINRNYGRETIYGYFTTQEKAEKWLKKNSKKYYNDLEVIQIVVS